MMMTSSLFIKKGSFDPRLYPPANNRKRWTSSTVDSVTASESTHFFNYFNSFFFYFFLFKGIIRQLHGMPDGFRCSDKGEPGERGEKGEKGDHMVSCRYKESHPSNTRLDRSRSNILASKLTHSTWPLSSSSKKD